MSAELLSRIPIRNPLASLGERAKGWLLIVLVAVTYLIGLGYHLVVWTSGTAPAVGSALAYNVLILLCYGLLWLLIARRVKERVSAPARIFWSLLLLGIFFIGIGYALSLPGRTAGLDASVPGFDYTTGVPLTLATVVKMNVLALLEAIFGFVLLLRFRDLVLFKRTKTAVRNFYLMLGFMAFAALCMIAKSPQTDLSPFHAVAMIPAVVFMVVNSFRLSWIVYPSFKEKTALIGLSLMMLVMLGSGIAISGENLMPEASAYLMYYSQPLNLFTTLTLVFGILYSTTTFLSLLFHLPTSGDFQRKADEMAAMHSLTNLVNKVFERDNLVSAITSSPVETGTADAAWLAMADPHSGSLRPRIVSTHNIDYARLAEMVDTAALYSDVFGSGEPLLLDQAPADHRVDANPGEGLGSMLVVPLVARDEVLAALFVSREVAFGFEKDDVEAISLFAAQAALALDNARLFEEQLEKERLSRELAIAREVQRKLLPQQLPLLDGVSMCASSISAQEVGGDYYDFAQVDEDRIALIIADVSGKGTSAAFYMAEMQGIFKAVSQIAPEPQDFLYHANRALTNSMEKNVFISVVYGLLDLKEEELVLARAGHCPAATINLHGEARYVRTQGLGLGLDPGPIFRKTLDIERIRLQPGDVLVLYTDGVVESRSVGGEEYGYDRLLEALRNHRHEDAGELHDSLMRDLDAFIEQENYGDDLTLLVLKWHGMGLSRPTVQHTALEKSPARPAVLE